MYFVFARCRDNIGNLIIKIKIKKLCQGADEELKIQEEGSGRRKESSPFSAGVPSEEEEEEEVNLNWQQKVINI